MVPSHHHSLCRRGSHADRQRHAIPFGHPYSCTPALIAIFEFNPAPSHSEVSQIMQQTGLKRKQITSWFWRKRKELVDPEDGDSNHDDEFHQRSSIQLEQAATPSLPQYGKPRDGRDGEYRPPGNARNRQRAHDEDPNLESTPSSHLSRPKPLPIHDQLARSTLALENQAAIHPNPPSKPKAQPASSSHISPSERTPILIRCKLRPLAQRVLNEAVDWDHGGSNESNNSGCPGGSTGGGSACPSSGIKTHIAPRKNDFSAPSPSPSELFDDSGPSSTSTIEHYQRGAFPSSTCSPDRNPSDDVSCDVDEPSESLYPLPINSHDDHLIMGEMRLGPASSSTASPQHDGNDDIISNITHPSLDPLPVNILCSSSSDIYRCQLGLGKPSRPPEYSASVARRMSAGRSAWLRPDRRLSYPGSGQVEPVSRNHSNAFRESSSDSYTDSSSPTQMEAGQGMCWRVSQEDLDLGSSSNLSTSSLGHEVHRWSELSEVDGASRYSSVSIESRASRCTNATIEDYSALLNTSSDTIMMCESPAAREELGTTRENMEFGDGRSPKNVLVGTRAISHSYRPLEQANTTTAVFQEDSGLSFPPSTCLMNQDLEVEEDPRLFMVHGDHQEYFDLLDWNPLGSFLNSAS